MKKVDDWVGFDDPWEVCDECFKSYYTKKGKSGHRKKSKKNLCEKCWDNIENASNSVKFILDDEDE